MLDRSSLTKYQTCIRMIGFRQNKKVINELGEMIYHIEEMSDLDDKNDNAEK